MLLILVICRERRGMRGRISCSMAAHSWFVFVPLLRRFAASMVCVSDETSKYAGLRLPHTMAYAHGLDLKERVPQSSYTEKEMC